MPDVEVLRYEQKVEQAQIDKDSPYHLVFDAAESIKRIPVEMDGVRMRSLSVIYPVWARAMAGKRVIIRPMPENENLERNLFGVFCEQLRVLGAKISPDEEQTAFRWFIED